VGCAIANRPAGFSSILKPLVIFLVGTVVLCVGSWFLRLIVSPAVPVGQGVLPDAFSGTGG
jgi:hypothetical protein